LLGVGSLALGLRRLRVADAPPHGRRRPDVESLAAYVLLAVAAAFGVLAARLLAAKPLLEFDGWAIWATRARALYEFGDPAAPVFTDPNYPALQYPLLVPALEAVGFRFMGGFDGTLIDLQLLGLAVAFVGGAWSLLRERTRPLLLAAVLLAIVTAPTFTNQLQTNYADVPLAMLLALGLAALAAWLADGDPGLLPAAALFLGAAALTKNEGEMFAVAAYVAAFAVARAGQRRPLALAALATLAIELPWRVWVQAKGVKIADYSLANLFDPGYLWESRDRVGPAFEELLFQLRIESSWSFLPWLVLFALVAAVVLRRGRLALFAAAWFALSLAGLLAIYWISRNPITDNLFNSSDRTTVTLMIGSALLVPVLLGVEREPEPGER
jgi:hypothetical protein